MTQPTTLSQRDLHEWSALRTWLESDPEGRGVLQRFLQDPASQRQVLEQWLTERTGSAPAQVSTIISGGNVGNIVNIAAAERVVLSLNVEPQSLYQLPSDVPDLTGRSAEIAECTSALLGQGTAGRTPIVLISGMPGVGKSALATRVCHELSALFPDAQLYLDLRGDRGAIAAATDALANVLAALGVPERALPPDLNSRAAQYRGLIAHRRALIFIDNAHSEEQVRPLIPSSNSCAMIVTSRTPLAIEGATSIRLDVLGADDGLELLKQTAGSERIDSDPGSAESLVSFSGGLPLALRIVGGMIRRGRHRPVSYYALALQDEQQRLGNLEYGDLQVRSSFDLSYRNLTTDEQRLFRFLGALPPPRLHESIIECMMDSSSAVASATIDRLVDAQLVDPVDGRFQLHELMRLFAREKLQRDETDEERRRLWIRLGQWFAPLVQLAYSFAFAKMAQTPAMTASEALQLSVGSLYWLDSERVHLEKVADELLLLGEWPLLFELAEPFLWYLAARGRMSEGLALARQASDAAHSLGDQKAEVRFRNILGSLYSKQSNTSQAQRSFANALEIARSANDRQAELAMIVNLAGTTSESRADEALGSLDQAISAYQNEFPDNARDYASALAVRGNILIESNRWDEAVQPLEEALQIAREANDLGLESSTLLSLGVALRPVGRYQEALEVYTRAGQIEQLLGDDYGYAGVLANTTAVYNGLGLWKRAIEVGEQALKIYARFGDLAGQGSALLNLGNAYMDLGRWADAHRSFSRALEIRAAFQDRKGMAEALSSLGNLASKQYRWEEAITQYSRARTIFEELELTYDLARLSVNIANAEVQLGRTESAANNLIGALPRLTSSGDRLSVGQALGNLGLAYATSGKIAEAGDCYVRSLEIFDDLGDAQARGATLHNIGRLLASAGAWDKAIDCYQQDLDICVKNGDRPGALTTLWEIGICWIQLNNGSQAEETFTQYLELARALENVEAEGRVLANLASLAAERGDSAQAIALGSRAHTILAKLGLKEATTVEAFLRNLLKTRIATDRQ